MATHRPEGLSGSTLFFRETFGTFPLLFEMIQNRELHLHPPQVRCEEPLKQTIRLGVALPPNHLARFVVDMILQLDLSQIYARYAPRGGEAFAPEILLGLLPKVWVRHRSVQFAQDREGDL